MQRDVLPSQIERFALDALAIGIIVTTRTGRVVYANAMAERMLGRPGGALHQVADKVVAANSAKHRLLLSLIANVCDGDDASAPSGGDHLFAPAVRETESDVALRILSGGPGRAMVFAREIERCCNLEAEGMRLFGLTEMEAKFASALAAGRSLAEAADANRVSVSTARAHLSRVFQKTGTKQQSQVAALLRSVQIPVEVARPLGWGRDPVLSPVRPTGTDRDERLATGAN